MTTPTKAELAKWREELASGQHFATQQEWADLGQTAIGTILSLLDALEETERRVAEVERRDELRRLALLDSLGHQESLERELGRAVELLRALLKGPCLEDDAAPTERFLASLDGRKQG